MIKVSNLKSFTRGIDITMDSINHNTSLRTNKHLSYAERFHIEKQLQAGASKLSIAKALGRSRTTIHAEIQRGTVEQIKAGKRVMVYLADHGQAKYETSRKGSFNTRKAGMITPFLTWVEDQVLEHKWSFDAAVGYALRKCLFVRNEMVSTKTLYNYLHEDLLRVKPMDLPLVLRRSMRKAITRKHKKNLGKSIELRDESVLTREEFGNWELDTVRGIKDKHDEVIISLLERKTRIYVTLRSPSAKAVDIKNTLHNWLLGFSTDISLQQLCKTITADNGLEFASITELETENLQIFFAHPYAAWERGSNERHNGLLRRIIPKGTPIRDVSETTLRRATDWCNSLPRKILNYRTPQEAFVEEVKKVVDLQSVQFDIAI